MLSAPALALAVAVSRRVGDARIELAEQTVSPPPRAADDGAG
jgi:hypothetical protein